MTILLRAIWALAGVALLLGTMRESVLQRAARARPLARVDATGAAWFTGEFKTGGAYPLTKQGQLPPETPHIGSWLGTDAWEGAAATEWFRVTGWQVRVGVAGYPQLPGCSLRAELRREDGTITRIDCPVANPREEWSVWTIWLPRGATAVRFVAEDRQSGHAGWLAVSHPFSSWAGELTATYQFAQIVATLALVLTLLWGPGLIAFSAVSRAAAPWRTVLLIGSGPLLLALIGVAVWCGGSLARPPAIGATGVLLIWTAAGVWLRRSAFRLQLGPALHRMLAVTALVVAAVVAKSFHSVGPAGELFRGTVSRNFEMTDRIDSRYSFYVVQVAAHRFAPASRQAEEFFFPWTFFSRGPLAGLAATPVVLATNGRPPAEMPEDRWQPYDPTGFAAYRITLIVLAGSIVLAFFVTLRAFVSDRWALIGAGLLALTPFGGHEMLFTWPKWAATAWLVASFGLAHARRPAGAGLVLGIGFLFHPLVLLWTPWLALWVAARAERRIGAVAAVLARLAAAAALIVVPWMALGALMPHLSTTPLPGQVGFLQYWARADWQIATWDTWWRTRWMNFANTFLPLHVILSESSFNHPKLGSAYETSSALVRFSQVWWNTLPFGAGLGLWMLSLVALGRSFSSGLRAVWSRTRDVALGGAVLVLVILPALFIVAYWGMDPLGLMRECGHPLLVAMIGLTCVIAARTAGWLRDVLAHPAFPWLQLPETVLMLWLTTLLNPVPWAAEFPHLDPLYLVLSVAALAAAAAILARGRGALGDDAPSASSVPEGSWRSRARQLVAAPPTWLVLAAGAVILALRRPDQIATPQLWAEDGIFFFQAHEMGARAFLHQLAGYFQLAPRLIAAAAAVVDPHWVPHVFLAGALGVTLYVMSRALSSRCPLPCRPLIALALVLVPDAAEVLLNANNVQWILAAGGVLLLLSAEPIRPAQWLHDVLAAFVIGMTGPFCVLLSPFFVARALRRKTKAGVVLAAIILLCAAVQLLSLRAHPSPTPDGGTLDLAAMAAFPGLRVLGEMLFGASLKSGFGGAGAIALTLMLGAGLGWLALRRSGALALRRGLVLLFLALLASTYYRCWHSMPEVSEPWSASRYVFPLQLLVGWLVITLLGDPARRVRGLAATLLLWCVAVNLPRLRIAPVPDKRWADYAPKLRKGEEVTVPINPDGWEFTFPARQRP